MPDSQGNDVSNAFFVHNADGTWTLIGKEDLIGDSTYLSWGTLGVDAYGKLGFKDDATLIKTYDNLEEIQQIDSNGNLTLVDVKDLQGNDLLQVSSPDATHSISYDSNGALTDGILESHYLSDVSLKLTGGQLDNYSSYQPVDKFDSILSGDLKDGYGFQISKNTDGTYNLHQTFGQTFTSIFENGIGTINPFTPSGAKNLMGLFMPQNLLGQIGQAEAQNIANTIQSRYNYFKDPSFGYTDNEAMAWSIYYKDGDLIGFTPLLEGIYGVDVTTGKLLTGGERALKLGEGLLSTVGNAIGGAELLHEIGFVPQIGNALSSATTALRTFNTELGEAGSVSISPLWGSNPSSITTWDEYANLYLSYHSTEDEARIGWQVYQEANEADNVLVIGGLKDTGVAKDWPGYKILDLENGWTPEVNDMFIQGGIDRKAKFYLGSPQNFQNLFNVDEECERIFARELSQLRKAGYWEVGDYYVYMDECPY